MEQNSDIAMVVIFLLDYTNTWNDCIAYTIIRYPSDYMDIYTWNIDEYDEYCSYISCC